MSHAAARQRIGRKVMDPLLRSYIMPVFCLTGVWCKFLTSPWNTAARRGSNVTLTCSSDMLAERLSWVRHSEGLATVIVRSCIVQVSRVCGSRRPSRSACLESDFAACRTVSRRHHAMLFADYSRLFVDRALCPRCSSCPGVLRWV